MISFSKKNVFIRSYLIKDIKAVVLAAGKGVRMRSDLPKVLHPLLGKSLLQHVIESLHSSGVDDTIVVVGYKGDMVIEQIGDAVEYAWQREQLGTGHAVMQAEEALKGFKGSVLIACGDVPQIRPETFKRMLEESEREKTRAVVLTMIQEDPTGYGRIIKDEQGNFVRIVEEKDATSEEKLEKEVNTGTYVINKESLFSGLKSLGKDNAQGEYYLTDVLHDIKSSGFLVNRVVLEDSVEGVGINSKEDLNKLEGYLKNK